MGSAEAEDGGDGSNKSVETRKVGKETWQDRQEIDQLADGIPVSLPIFRRQGRAETHRYIAIDTSSMLPMPKRLNSF